MYVQRGKKEGIYKGAYTRGIHTNEHERVSSNGEISSNGDISAKGGRR